MCNVLPVILKANYDDPVDSAQDIVDRNLTLLMPPWTDMWKQWLATHANPHYRKISETAIIPESWVHHNVLMEHGIIENNTHVTWRAYLTPWEKSLGLWWRSKEVFEGEIPFGGFLTRKKWKHYEVNYNLNF